MKGRVVIIDELSNEVLLDKTNLTVLGGRQIIQHRFTNTAGLTQDFRQHYLRYFSIGTGGADPNNPLIPIEPTENDTTLVASLILNVAGINYQLGGVLKPVASITHTSGTTTVVELHIDQTDVSATTPIYYSEAGLFAATGTFPGDATNTILTAHICFPSVIKTPDRSQRMFWYLFF